MNLDFDYKKYLQTLHDEGMNMTRTFSGTYVEKPKSFNIENNTLAPQGEGFICPWARSGVAGYKSGGNKFDLDAWDQNYFGRLKDFVSTAEKYGIIVEFTLFSSIYSDESWTWCPLYHENNINSTDMIARKNVHTPANGNLITYQEKFVRKIVAELKEYPNVIYEIQNEPWPDNTGKLYSLNINLPVTDKSQSWRNIVELPSEASLEWQAKVSSWIRDEEKDYDNKHLISQNYCNFYYPVEKVDPAISIMNFHYAWPQAVHYNYGYDRIISFNEDGFKGSTDDPYRRAAWNFILAGGGIYNNLDYSFFAGSEDGTGINNAPGSGSKTLRKQLAFLREFIESFDFIQLKPDLSVVKLAPGTIPQVLANPGKEYAIYLSGGTQCDLKLYLPEGKYTAEWINPVSFNTDKAEDVINTGKAVILASPYYEREIALRIRRVR